MKQSTFKTKLNQYFGDTDQYIDKVIEGNVEIGVLEKAMSERMEQIGVERFKDQADIMFDIIGNEEDARKEGREPIRKVYYYTEYEEPEEGVPPAKYKNQAVAREVWLDYTEDDYYFLLAVRERIEQAFKITLPSAIKASVVIAKHFSEEADLITAECLSILHTATKADCEDYLRRTRDYIKGLGLTADLEKYLLKYQIQADKAEALDVNFFGPLQDPFTMAIQKIRQEERKQLEDQDPKDFIDFVFKDMRRIHEETRTVISQWYGPPANVAEPGKRYLRQNKLARTKEINALQTLNLARDNKGTRHKSTTSGGILAERVFENNGVEVVSSRLENISLSTNTRQVLDYYLFKGVEQITHHGGKDLNRLDKQRAVETDLDEVATVFSIDRKEARRRLNDFYDETRDLKMRIHYVVKDGKGKYKEYVATVNIFDADLQEIDQEELNARRTPEELDDGVQISFYNTGTLYHYNPKTAPKSKKAVKRGRLTMQFSLDFAKHLAQASIVQHNPKGYLVNRRKYTSAYSVQCTLENHFNMNRGKSNAGIISLEALLKDCYEIPTYDTVMNGNRNVTARIKKPLLSNVQALKDVGVLQDFHYCDPMKRNLSEGKLLTLDYDDFINCKLHFTLSPIEE